MANPYVGEIRLFAGNFAPVGWAICDGSLLAIGSFDTLFNLIGTTYGGDGQQTFALPDLRGRVPIHQGAGPGLSNRVIGERGGSETVTLTVGQLPMHTHSLRVSNVLSNGSAGRSGVLAATAVNIYDDAPAVTPMAMQAISAVGGSQPHDNMAPCVGVNYIISLFGVFPSQN